MSIELVMPSNHHIVKPKSTCLSYYRVRWVNILTVLGTGLAYSEGSQSVSHFFLYNEILKGPTSISREGNGTPLQYCCLENPMDGGAWWAAVHGVTKSRTWLSDFTFNFHFYALKKQMATHSSVLAWRIPGMVEPGGLPSMGSHRVRHDWRDLAAAEKTEGRRSRGRQRIRWLDGITDLQMWIWANLGR